MVYDCYLALQDVVKKKDFLKKILFIFRELGREGETSLCGCLSHTPTGYLACNPGMCPDWESNQRPFGSQPSFNPLSYTGQAKKKKKILFCLVNRENMAEFIWGVCYRLLLALECGWSSGICVFVCFREIKIQGSTCLFPM